ncbi:hypothetical protein Sarmat_01081 [Rickettsiales endosymbiont of Paramecium tredecaurelia]|uniref:hypothetical protein n=1 Tax=Candidatus Sarmatiella mevalonica TaxID=2770581 RepID=UPI001920BD07|nr:hypothetical protein [Candidatus Sarmatiella mevalonica]MBL3285210.1 hypothetical protein [Candidatus Sarmatiella mevalonica]
MSISESNHNFKRILGRSNDKLEHVILHNHKTECLEIIVDVDSLEAEIIALDESANCSGELIDKAKRLLSCQTLDSSQELRVRRFILRSALEQIHYAFQWEGGEQSDVREVLEKLSQAHKAVQSLQVCEALELIRQVLESHEVRDRLQKRDILDFCKEIREQEDRLLALERERNEMYDSTCELMLSKTLGQFQLQEVRGAHSVYKTLYSSKQKSDKNKMNHAIYTEVLEREENNVEAIQYCHELKLREARDAHRSLDWQKAYVAYTKVLEHDENNMEAKQYCELESSILELESYLHKKLYFEVLRNGLLLLDDEKLTQDSKMRVYRCMGKAFFASNLYQEGKQCYAKVEKLLNKMREQCVIQAKSSDQFKNIAPCFPNPSLLCKIQEEKRRYLFLYRDRKNCIPVNTHEVLKSAQVVDASDKKDVAILQQQSIQAEVVEQNSNMKNMSGIKRCMNFISITESPLSDVGVMELYMLVKMVKYIYLVMMRVRKKQRTYRHNLKKLVMHIVL